MGDMGADGTGEGAWIESFGGTIFGRHGNLQGCGRKINALHSRENAPLSNHRPSIVCLFDEAADFGGAT